VGNGFEAYVDARTLSAPYDISWVQLDILCQASNGSSFISSMMFHKNFLARGELYKKSFSYPQNCYRWIRLEDAKVGLVAGKAEDPWGADISVQQGPIGGAAQDPSEITIYTGSVTGIEYSFGGAVCRLFNNNRKVHGFRCRVESSAGPLPNISAIRDGLSEFAIVGSDYQARAYTGIARFSNRGPFSDLRSVFSFYPNTFTLVTSVDVPNVVVYYVAKSVFENLSTFKKLHPYLEGLNPLIMINKDLAAPLHPGAHDYYIESGLMQ
jgi:TRAP-type uncharacterized transport system substrate-binding protein